MCPLHSLQPVGEEGHGRGCTLLSASLFLGGQGEQCVERLSTSALPKTDGSPREGCKWLLPVTFSSWEFGSVEFMHSWEVAWEAGAPSPRQPADSHAIS